MPALIYKSGTAKERVFPLRLGLNGVGRDRDNQVCLNRADVSRHHAEIAVTPERVILKDLDSSNHSFVNGRKVRLTELSDGDEVRFSSIRFSYRAADGPTASQADAPAGDDVADLAAEIAARGRVDGGVTPERRAELRHMVAEISARHAVGQAPPSLLRIPEGWADDRHLAQLQVLLDVANRLASPCGVTARMGRALELLLTYLDVDRAALLVQSPRGGPADEQAGPRGDEPSVGALLQAMAPPRRLAARARSGVVPAEDGVFWESTLVATALAKRGPALSVDDAPGGGVRVALCQPLGEQAVDAVLYVANQSVSGPYADEDLEFITGFAEQIGIALANARALEALQEDEDATSVGPPPTDRSLP
jgi:adenylate cyclase